MSSKRRNIASAMATTMRAVKAVFTGLAVVVVVAAVYAQPPNPPGMTPEVGMQLAMTNQHGHQIPVTIIEVRPDVVVLDANHQLAGEDLVFDLELVEIVGGGSWIIMP